MEYEIFAELIPQNGLINIIRFEKSDYTILFFLKTNIYQNHRQDNLNNLK